MSSCLAGRSAAFKKILEGSVGDGINVFFDEDSELFALLRRHFVVSEELKSVSKKVMNADGLIEQKAFAFGESAVLVQRIDHHLAAPIMWVRSVLIISR